MEMSCQGWTYAFLCVFFIKDILILRYLRPQFLLFFTLDGGKTEPQYVTSRTSLQKLADYPKTGQALTLQLKGTWKRVHGGILQGALSTLFAFRFRDQAKTFFRLSTLDTSCLDWVNVCHHHRYPNMRVQWSGVLKLEIKDKTRISPKLLLTYIENAVEEAQETWYPFWTSPVGCTGRALSGEYSLFNWPRIWNSRNENRFYRVIFLTENVSRLAHPKWEELA